MESSAVIKEEDGVESANFCRWCLSTGDALEALENDESGQFTDLQIEFSPGVPSYLCTTCEARLKKQNKAKNGSQITQEDPDQSAEQTVGTELSIKTEVSSPDTAKDVHKKCYTVHQANMTYECCGEIPDDLFEAEEHPIAIKSENEEVDEQHHEQDNQKSNPLESICQDQKDHPVPVADNTCGEGSTAESNQNVLRPGTGNAHSKSHSKNHKHHCPHCSATYPFLSMLKVHIRTHTGEKPYQCKTCDKAFASSTTLALHSKIHKKDLQHQCPHCSSMFTQSSKLKIHIRTHTGERPYQCRVCDQAFRNAGNLTEHSKIHNKDQQHQCPHCASMFARSSNLKIHIRTHTGEKPYQCKVCDKAFRTSGNLVRHSKIHNKAEPH